jgi:hypothetical protein
MPEDLSSEMIRRRDTGTTGARAPDDEMPTQEREPVRGAAAAVTAAAAVGEAAFRTAAAEPFKEPAKEDTGAVRKVGETKTLVVGIPAGGGGEKAGSGIPDAPEGPPREAELGARRKSPRRRSPHSGNIHLYRAADEHNQIYLLVTATAVKGSLGCSKQYGVNTFVSFFTRKTVHRIQ